LASLNLVPFGDKIIMAVRECDKGYHPEAVSDRKGPGQDLAPKGTPPVTFLWPKVSSTMCKNSNTSLGPTSQHLSLWETFHIQTIVKVLNIAVSSSPPGSFLLQEKKQMPN
jgi:hypothetical protein